MKTRILGFAIALIALFIFTIAYAANPQWNKGPCLDGNTLKGKITGIGNQDLTIIVTGEASCTNPAQKEPNPWQNFTKTVTVSPSKNGTYTLNWNLKLCNRNWNLEVQNLTIEVWQGGQRILGPNSVTIGC